MRLAYLGIRGRLRSAVFAFLAAPAAAVVPLSRARQPVRTAAQLYAGAAVDGRVDGARLGVHPERPSSLVGALVGRPRRAGQKEEKGYPEHGE